MVSKRLLAAFGALGLFLTLVCIPSPAQDADPFGDTAEDTAAEAPATGDDGAPAEETPAASADEVDTDLDLKGQWESLLHYINVARPQIARSFAGALLNNPDAQPRDLYLLSVDNPESLRILQKGQSLPELKDPLITLRKKIEEGYQAWRSDPEQIAESIAMMGRSLRGYVVGKQRLQASGEYALPLLIQKLMSAETPEVLRQRIVTMLGEMGRQAVRGYSVALQAKDLKLVGFIANALGEIQYPAALPRLREALLREDLQDPNNPTRKIILSAILSCGGGGRSALDRSLSELFYELAERYYDRAESLQPENTESGEKAFVWFWKEGLGLESRPVPAPILCDVYAMRMGRLAIRYDASFYPAVPLWLSACIRRQIDLPAGATDPLWVRDVPQSSFYALASSPRYLQAVLARALADNNLAIARKVIETMGKTTGAKALVEPIAGGAQPLVSALGYPDRSVRYLAAETLALALPTQPFAGSQNVLTTLNEAIRHRGGKTALVVVLDETRQNDTVDLVRAAGYEVLRVSEPSAVLIEAAKVAGPDVVFLGPDVDHLTVVRRFRNEPIYHYLPVVIHNNAPSLRRFAERDARSVTLASETMEAQAIAQALAQAIAMSAGEPVDAQQAQAWAIRAARAVETIGKSTNVIYDVLRAVDPLADALQADNADLQKAAAAALAAIQSSQAQQAVVGLALNDQAPEDVRIAAFQAASRSVRRFGNEAADDQARAVVEMVSNAKDQGPLNEAAARLLGSMNLPSEKMPELILSTDTME